MPAAADFRDVFKRRLRRRRLAAALEGARRGGRRSLAAAGALLLLVALGVLPPPGGPFLAAGLLLAFLAAGAAGGALLALRREGTAVAFARTLDAALGGEDMVSAAAALAARLRDPGRFGAALLERAAAELAAVPPERIGAAPRPPWGLLGLALLVALLVSLLPPGGFGVLPGLGYGWGTGGRPRTGGATWGTPAEKEGGTPRADPGAVPEGSAGAPAAKEPEAPRGEGPEPTPPREEGSTASLEMAALARTYGAGAPVTVAATATGGPAAGEGVDLTLFVSVDGKEPAGEGAARRIAAGTRDARALDLRGIPALIPHLGPGTHRVEGELRDGTGRTLARAPEIEIVIDGGEDPAGKGGGTPEPRPRPDPRKEPSAPPAPPPPPPPAPAAGERERPRPQPRVDLPPSRFEERVVRPLFGEGAEVEKRGKILVLDPEGSRGDPPREVAPEEALAEVRARAEDAARREGVDPRDAESVRLYFEALRRLLEGRR